MTIIYLARHGEYNNPNRLSPYRLPGFSLTELGQKQSALIAARLAEVPIHTLFTSPITRCLETATIIGEELNLPPNPRNELIETGTPLAGISLSDPRHSLPDYLYNLPEHINGGGESPEQIYARFHDFIEQLRLTPQNSNYLLVSHADPIMIYLYGAHQLPLPRTDQEIVRGNLRYIPMGGLIQLTYTSATVPDYQILI